MTALALAPSVAHAATFTVNAWDDAESDGSCDPFIPGPPPRVDCTLRDAIDASNNTGASDTIVIGPIVEPGFPGFLSFSRLGSSEDGNATGDFDIVENTAGLTLTIQGSNIDVADVTQTDRIFHTLPTNAGAGQHHVDLTVNDTPLRWGLPPFGEDGGCILAEEGHLTVNTSTLTECATRDTSYTPGQGGGAIAALGGLDLNGVQISQNSAQPGDGGGVLVQGDLTVNQSAFGLNNAGGGHGGAVAWLGNGHSADISDSGFGDNTSAGDGGGLYLDDRGAGGDISLTDVNLDFNESTAGDGGAFWIHAASTELLRVASGNNTSRASGGVGGRGGGGVIVPGSPTTAPLVDRSSFYENTSDDDGGGLFIHTANGTSTGTHIIRNTTLGGNECGTGGQGCGLSMDDGAFGPPGSPTVTVELEHCTVAQNQRSTGGDYNALDVNGANADLEYENSIIEGECFGTVTSLGGNVLHSSAFPTFSGCDDSGTGDFMPSVVGALADSLWDDGASPPNPMPPTLVTSTPLPYYQLDDGSSFLLDAVDSVTCPTAVTVDQLGGARPTTPGTCDAGSIED